MDGRGPGFPRPAEAKNFGPFFSPQNILYMCVYAYTYICIYYTPTLRGGRRGSKLKEGGGGGGEEEGLFKTNAINKEEEERRRKR